MEPPANLQSGIPFSQLFIMQNLGVIEYCRTSTAVASGCTAGILGLTGVYGFIFYFVFGAIVSISLIAMIGKDWQKYFLSKKQFATHGYIGGLFTYILFWTFLYGMVHVY